MNPNGKSRLNSQTDRSGLIGARQFQESRKGSTTRIEIIDALRGLAALSVCWYHFTQGVGEFLPEGPVKASGRYGFRGVAVFFVISGFVIPYTLFRQSYNIRDYGRFIAKRIVRLDPPYFVSLAMVLGVGFFLMRFTNYKRGILPYSSWQQIVFHIGYLNAVLHYEWLSPVYWSLAVEFQYYLALGLLFPLFSRWRTFLPLFALFCAAARVLSFQALVFPYLPWFLFGVVAFKFVANQFGLLPYIVLTATLLINACFADGVLCAGVLCATSLLITFVRFPIGNILRFFGAISYSLYLTHAPIGATVINLSKHFDPTYYQKLFVLALALALTVFVSYLMYRFVEKPSLNLAAKIRYQVKKKPLIVAEPAEAPAA
jgi:peptidoglycan/LPS O-acetylase OafA/YrhL